MRQSRGAGMGAWVGAAIVGAFLLGGGAASAAVVARQPVVVYGATPAGIAAAVTAARLGTDVVLVEPTRHVGGVLSNGLTNADIINRKAVGGFFEEFIDRVRQHYRSTYGETSPQFKACRNGYYFEPSVAEKIFLACIAEQSRIRLLCEHRLSRVLRQGTTVTGIVVNDLRKAGSEVSLAATVCIDASYEGDVLAQAGAAFRLGRESRQEFGELHAGKIYTYFGTSDPLPGSTGEGDRGIQAYCFRIFVTRKADNLVPLARPDTYNAADYDLLAEDFAAGRVKRLNEPIQLYPMPNDKFEINSNHVTTPEKGPSESLDLAEENWGYPEGNPAQREAIVRRIRDHNLGLLWFLGHDPRVPEGVRKEMLAFGLCKDEFADNGHWPDQVYVRESRRLVGRYTLTENDGRLVENQRTRLQPTSIGIAEFPWDCHGVHRYSAEIPGSREGYFYVAHPPVQIPYGVLLPRQLEGLLAPVCCSASHVGYQSLRVEPCYMTLGQAAGVAAYLAAKRRMDLDEIAVEDLQMLLVERKAIITHFEDLPTDHPAFAALQFLGARAFNVGYQATPDAPLSRRQAVERLQRLMRAMGVRWAPPTGDLDRPLAMSDVVAWIRPLGWLVPDALVGPAAGKDLTVADLAQAVYSALRAKRCAESGRPLQGR